MEKYYTPDRSEFKIGFEYEFKMITVLDSPNLYLKPGEFLDQEKTKEDGTKYYWIGHWVKCEFGPMGDVNLNIFPKDYFRAKHKKDI